MCVKTLVDTEILVEANDPTNFRRYWLTRFMPCLGSGDTANLYTLMHIQNLVEELRASWCVQFAVASPIDADDPREVGTLRSTAGPHDEAIDLSALTVPTAASRYLWRLGLAVNSSTDENSSARIYCHAAVNDKGSHQAPVTRDVMWPSTSRGYLPLGIVVPRKVVNALRVGFVVSGATTDLEYGLGYRVYDNRLNPGNWSTLITPAAAQAADDRRCDNNDLSGVSGTEQLLEVALAVEAASSVAYGRVTAAISFGVP